MTVIFELVALIASRDKPRSEADVQAQIRELLTDPSLGIGDEIRLEKPVEGGRIDVEIGSTVIEVKKDLRNPSILNDAVRQLCGYVSKREGTYGRRYVGVLTDGAEWHCYHLKQGKLHEAGEPLLVSSSKPDVDSLLVWLEGVLATARDIKPTPDEIRWRLGHGSSSHALDRSSLADLFEQNRDAPVVSTKRRLWARLLETALGTQFEDSDALFVDHTLLVNTAEIIAHAVLGIAPETVVPRSLLSGAKFHEAGVHGVVEADFFDWVVEVPKGDTFVRTLARRISRFDWSAVEHDVLKVLYESVIAADVRKKLGEYYTPDWLAQVIVDTVVTDPLTARVLDPSCGSGTFLFHLVRRYVAAAEGAGRSTQDTLDGVTEHVLGMDLHPVAVTLARVTYLLAIGPQLLTDPNRGVIRVPVFIGDSMQWAKARPTLWSTHELRIPVDDQRGIQRELTESEFVFPQALLRDPRAFDDLVSQMADLAVRERKPSAKYPSLGALFQRLAITDEVRPTLTSTFNLMCRLHDEGRDHIWGYYIRNLARPEWLTRPENQVDMLVGNPPWLAFRYMPTEMQADFRRMSEARGLWHGAKVATNQDLSALFVVRATELYLQRGGRFAFVMPSSVLDKRQYAGFRSGEYGGASDQLEMHATLEPPWDLREVRPHFFPITASVAFGRRTNVAGKMPAAGERWIGKLRRTNAPWSEVVSQIRRENSSTDRGQVQASSRYHSRFRQGASIVPRVLFIVERVAAGPLGQVRNRAAVRSARSANEKAPWKSLAAQDGVVESEFVVSVMTGESVLQFRLMPAQTAVLPIGPKGILGAAAIEAYPGLADWWARARATWNANRSNDRLSLEERLDYHGELSAQLPITTERVVYNTSGMHLVAARLQDRRAIVDTKLYWAAVTSSDEGRFLCAILNATSTSERIRPLMSFSKDERDIHKLPWSLPIPTFDASCPLHARLANLGNEAEALVAQIALEGKHFGRERGRIREVLNQSEIGRAIEKDVAELLGSSPPTAR